MFKFILVLFTSAFAVIITKKWLDLILETFIDKDKFWLFNGIVYSIFACSIVLMLTYCIYFIITCEVII
jgi:hypothetical protein